MATTPKATPKPTTSKKETPKKAPAPKPGKETDVRTGPDVVGLGTDLEQALKKAGAGLDRVKASVTALKAEKVPTNAQLLKLRDTVNEVAAKAREAEQDAVAKQLSQLNRLVRRLERSTR